MKIVHKLGYVTVFGKYYVRVYTEQEFEKRRQLLDLTAFIEEWQGDEPGGE